jgi:hypothetical protein
MKIGLLTHHWVYNFGANLQVLSTVKYLEQLGHEVYVLNYRIPALVEKYQRTVPVAQAKAHEDFCALYLSQTPVCENQEEITQVAAELQLDAVICGSDAVLRLNISSTREDLVFPNPFWLTWTESVGVKNKGLLAASAMGSNYFNLPPAFKKGIQQALLSMDYVTIRDKWTQFSLSFVSKSWADMSFCPDPVMVLEEGILKEEVSSFTPAEKGSYILLSIYNHTVTDEWVEFFVEKAHQHGFMVYSLPQPEYEVTRPVDKVIPLPLSPLSWYGWIKNAAGYVGVRFHPIVCAMVNDVPFVALDNYELSLKRRLTRVATKPMSSLLRLSSKTYDLCSRAKQTKYCLNPKQHRKLSPQQIFNLVQEQMSEKRQNAFVMNSQIAFKQTMDNILKE